MAETDINDSESVWAGDALWPKMEAVLCILASFIIVSGAVLIATSFETGSASRSDAVAGEGFLSVPWCTATTDPGARIEFR